MTYFEYYDLFFNVLNMIRNTLKCERLSIAINRPSLEATKGVKLPQESNASHVKKQIEAYLEVPYINQEGKDILAYLINQDFGEGKQISIDPAQNAFENYKYIIPKSGEIRNATLNFFSPILFSSIGSHVFYEILCSVFLEKSVVFVSENYNLITTAVY